MKAEVQNLISRRSLTWCSFTLLFPDNTFLTLEGLYDKQDSETTTRMIQFTLFISYQIYSVSFSVYGIIVCVYGEQTSFRWNRYVYQPRNTKRFLYVVRLGMCKAVQATCLGQQKCRNTRKHILSTLVVCSVYVNRRRFCRFQPPQWEHFFLDTLQGS